jgi:hypothetical protein
MTAFKHLIAWSLAVFSTNLVATPGRTMHNMSASSREPFRSFRMLDAKLTLLIHQQATLKATLNPGQMGSRTTDAKPPSWITASKNMSYTAAGIGRIAGALEHLYRRRHQPFGVRMFRILRIRARAVRRSVYAVAKARTRSEAELAEKKLDEQMVSLIVQFQAASGGYGATRCSPRAWTCCEPKRSEDLLQGEKVGCKWRCVQRSKRCTGFLGPRIP